MAFEAFPDDGEMIEQVAQLATAFLGGFDPALFDEAQSLSYPAFLDQLPRRTS
jgi:hypothetical protein